MIRPVLTVDRQMKTRSQSTRTLTLLLTLMWPRSLTRTTRAAVAVMPKWEMHRMVKTSDQRRRARLRSRYSCIASKYPICFFFSLKIRSIKLGGSHVNSGAISTPDLRRNCYLATQSHGYYMYSTRLGNQLDMQLHGLCLFLLPACCSRHVEELTV